MTRIMTAFRLRPVRLALLVAIAAIAFGATLWNRTQAQQPFQCIGDPNAVCDDCETLPFPPEIGCTAPPPFDFHIGGCFPTFVGQCEARIHDCGLQLNCWQTDYTGLPCAGYVVVCR